MAGYRRPSLYPSLPTSYKKSGQSSSILIGGGGGGETEMGLRRKLRTF